MRGMGKADFTCPAHKPPTAEISLEGHGREDRTCSPIPCRVLQANAWHGAGAQSLLTFVVGTGKWMSLELWENLVNVASHDFVPLISAFVQTRTSQRGWVPSTG